MPVVSVITDTLLADFRNGEDFLALTRDHEHRRHGESSAGDLPPPASFRHPIRRAQISRRVNRQESIRFAVAFRTAYGNAGTAIVRIYDFAHRDAHAIARVGDGREYLAFAGIGKRVQTGERTGVVEVGVHVRVEDDFGNGQRNGGGVEAHRPGKEAYEQATGYRYVSHDGCIVAFRRL